MKEVKLNDKPVPENVQFVNDLFLANISADFQETNDIFENPPADNVRVYVPLDLSENTLITELYSVIKRHGRKATWSNETDFLCDMTRWIMRLEIYDRVRTAQNGSADAHTSTAIELANLAISKLEECEGDTENFPYNAIDEIKDKFLN